MTVFVILFLLLVLAGLIYWLRKPIMYQGVQDAKALKDAAIKAAKDELDKL